MTLWILLALALYYTYLFVPALMLFGRVGLGAYMGSRDNDPTPTILQDRAKRAHRNYLENLPVFAALALLAMIAPETDTNLATFGAAIFVIARAVYLPLYVMAVPAIRSATWIASLVGLGMIAFAIL